jgi:endonuclease YncB( thermonuclease family)
MIALTVAATIACPHPVVIDGDTLKGCGPAHIRLARIDAPELHGCPRNHHCAAGSGKASKAALQRIIGQNAIVCHPVPASPRGGSVYDRWGRIVARCSVNGRDIGSMMIAGGYAVRWPHD